MTHNKTGLSRITKLFLIPASTKRLRFRDGALPLIIYFACTAGCASHSLYDTVPQQPPAYYAPSGAAAKNSPTSAPIANRGAISQNTVPANAQPDVSAYAAYNSPPTGYASSGNPSSGIPSTYAGQPQDNSTATNAGYVGSQPPAQANLRSNQPYYAAQQTPYTTTARMVDPNVVPVGANEVGPPTNDPMPPVGMGGPAPGAPNATGPYPTGQTPWAGPAPIGNTPMQGQMPGQAPGQPAGGPPPAQVVPAIIVATNDDDEGFDLSHLEPDYTWKKLKNLIGWGPDENIAKQAYAAGQAFYRNKQYDEAAEQFYLASWRWPDSLLEEDSMFLEAESYFFADRYGKAEDAYSGLLKKHENTRYLDTTVARLFAIATFWEQLDMQYHNWPLTPNATDKTRPIFDTFGNMLAAYRAVWLNDPTGPLADVAVWRVANAHFRRGDWEDAAYHYGLIRKNHPKSKYQKDAHLLELQARMRLYQGPRYSASPLAEAEEIANQTLKQFAGQLGDEETRVRQTKTQIVELRAERDWMMAQYYDNKADYGAAKYYYRDILDKFPHTNCAERTRQRLPEIQGLPDEPPKHFEWLTGVFEHDR